MVYFRKNLIKKITVFLLVTAILFWMVPSNLIFGSGESTDIEVLQQALADAQKQLADAQGAAENAAEELEAAQAAADEASAALADAQVKADDANTALSDAQAKADEANDELEDAEKNLADARAALDAANEDEEATEEDIAALEQDVADAEDARDEAKGKADEANAKLADVQAAADVANAALADARAAADEANKVLEEAKAKDEQAKAAVAEAEKAVADAQAALDAALNNKDSGQNDEGTGQVLKSEEPVTNPVLSTDKEDYAPGETVIITGKGFLPNAVYTIVVIRPDGSIVTGDGTFVPGSDSVLSDASGNFTYSYILNGIEGTYQVRAVDEEGNTVSSTTFTDAGRDITVKKFGDDNGNGNKGGNEPWLEGVVLKLQYKWFGNWRDSSSGSRTTDSNGEAKWLDVSIWFDYRVVEVSNPNSGYTDDWVSDTISAGRTNVTIEAPNAPSSGGCVDVEYPLNDVHQGANSASLPAGVPEEPGDNGGITTPGVVWHFILNGLDSGTPAATIYGEFESAGTFTVEASNDGQTQHFWVWTPTDDILVYTSTNYVYALADSCNYNNLVLSHVCHNEPVTADIYFDKDFKNTGGSSLSSPGVFNIYDASDTGFSNPLKPSIPLYNDGEVRFEDLAPGNYVIVEDPAGVHSDGTPYAPMPDIEVTVNDDGSVTYTSPSNFNNGDEVENNKVPTGEIKVKKNVENVHHDTQLFEVELYMNDSDVPFNPADPTSNGWTLVPGGTKQIKEWYTTATWYNLVKGKYYEVREVNIPDDYTFISTDGPKLLACEVEIEVVNRKSPKGSITVTKTGLEGNDQANLSLYDSDDNLVNTATAPSPQTVSNNGTAQWLDLPHGDYSIEEDFNGITNVYTYTVSNPVADITVDGDETDTIDNTAEKGSITIKKIGLEGNDTANLTLYRDDDGVSGQSDGDTSYGSNLFSDDEVYTWSNLPYGNYYIIEDFDGITNVYDYDVTNPVWSGAIEGDVGSVGVPINVENCAEKGSITVTKTGLEGNDQANLSLYDSNDNLVDTATAPSPQTVSNNGTAQWLDLPYGDYSIVEDFDGITNVYTYTVSNPVADITVDGDETDTIDNTAEKGSITIKKSGLHGSDTAIFSLEGPGGPYPDITLDNKTGGYPSEDSWDNLPYGDYTITETWGDGNVYTYNTDLSPNPKTINVDGNETINVRNTKLTYSVTVNKTGLEWGYKSSWPYYWADKAVFTLTGPAGPYSQVRTVTLDNYSWNDLWGGPYSSKTWTGLPAGEYTLTESYSGSNRYDYTSNITLPDTFELGPSKTFNVVNTPEKGSITVTKTGLEGNDQAIFSLSGPGGPYSSITLSEGESDGWDDLQYGSYTITESYPGGNVYTYQTDLSSDPVVIGSGNKNPTIEVENTAEKGSIVVTKTGLLGNDTAKFSLSGPGGPYADIELSEGESDGWNDLPYGTYTVTESYPGGNIYNYTTVDVPTTVEVNSQTPEEIDVTNNPIYGKVTLTKLYIGDVVDSFFYLKGDDGNYYMQDGTVAASRDAAKVTISTQGGTATWENLPHQEYTIEEDDIAGYSQLITPESFTLSRTNEIQPVIATNTQIPGRIELEKVYEGDPATAYFYLKGEDGKYYGQFGVGYNNLYTWMPWLYRTINGEGSIYWMNLPWQEYTIYEVTPSGYTSEFNPEMPVTIDGETPEQTVSVTATNTQILGTVNLTKAYEGDVVDSFFYMEDGSGNYYLTDGTTTSDKASATYKIDTEGGTIKWENLPWNVELTIIEEAIDGYDSEFDTAMPIIINETTLDQTVSVTATNRELGSIEIFKTDAETGEPLGGSTFALYKEGSWILQDTQVLGPDGHFKWEDLEWGTYMIREEIAPTGYLVCPDQIVVIGENQRHYTLREEIADPRIPGEITLNKSGLGSTSVAGFTLYDSDGDAVGGEKTITGDGTVTWSNLKWDTYRIEETTVPSGYNKMADITGIVIDARNEDQQSYTFDRTNSRISLGSITLNKSGLDSDDTAGFTLYNSDGAAVGGEKRITGNGTVRWTNLPRDTYKIVETTVPSGYSKMSDINGIVVSSAQLNHSFSRTNKTKTTTTTTIEVLGIQELPFTGMNPAIPISGIGSILAGGLMVMLSFIRRKFRRK